jgi:CheY-like chemotaxis protein
VKPRILLVEDNEQNRYLATYLLQASSMEVIAAQNGIEALKLLHSTRFDLILTDIQLPMMDGYDLAKILKQDPKLRQIPLVAATSFAMAGDREKALQLGFDGYMEKPYDPETFVAQIQSCLSGPESRE